jgi:glucokinase
MSKNFKKHYLGIDLGGTKLLVGLLNDKFELIGSEKVKVKAATGEAYFFKSLTDSVQKVLDAEHLTILDIAGIGIVVSSPNIEFLKNYPLKTKLSNHFKCPVAIGNDVSVGLYGEHQFGAAKGFNHVLGIFVGTGVGGSLILNGQIYHGATGSAGEIGHILVNPMGALCGCGKRGCLETEIGRPSISAEAAVLALKDLAPKLLGIAGTDVAKIKSGALEASINQGDVAIKGLIKHKAKLLGMAMANLVNILNPEMIVLGGGVIEAMGKIMVPEADKTMRAYGMVGLVEEVKVVSAKLGDFAVVKGAAKLIADLIRANP